MRNDFERVRGALEEFESGEYAETFRRCHRTLSERNLGKSRHLPQILAALEAKKRACIGRVFDEEPHVEDGLIQAAMSYMDPGNDDVSRYNVVGFTLEAGQYGIDVVERPFPLEIHAPDVIRAHIHGSDGFGINSRDPDFNLMTATAILMASIFSENYFSENGNDYGETYPVALPGKRGLYIGHVEREDPENLLPHEVLYRIRQEKRDAAGRKSYCIKASDKCQAIPFAGPRCTIVLDSFVGRGQDQCVAEQEIRAAYDQLLADPEVVEGVFTASDWHFKGGLERKMQVHKIMGLSPAKIRAMGVDIEREQFVYNKASTAFIEDLLDTPAWYRFANIVMDMAEKREAYGGYEAAVA